ncbi:glycosyltransferase [Thermodesulfobacteriota bacterium]
MSVIIPNYNGALFIDHLCHSLASQTLASDLFEIVFVDNGSTDKSMDILNRYAELLSNVRIIRYTKQQSSYAARNHGVENCKGEVLVFTDIDCRPHADWLDNIYDKAKGQAGDFLLTGKVELFPAGDDFNFYEWYDLLFSLDQENYAKSKTGATANLAVSRSAYKRVKGFQALISGGDLDFCRRVIAAGDTDFHYYPEIKVLHPARDTPEEIRKKFARVSEGKAVLFFHALSPTQRFFFILKQAIGLFLQPHQVKKIMKTFKQKGWKNLWVWQFAFITMQLGFFIRLKLIHKFVNLCRNERAS